MDHQPTFEVETRLHFATVEEAYERIPFLKESLTRRNKWKTVHFGPDLFKNDQIVRIGETLDPSRFFLGWKGKDLGNFANIREELDEEITHGIEESAILKLLGGIAKQPSYQSVLDELHRLGFEPFMSFDGANQSGFYEPLRLHLKLMHCQVLKWPLMVEMEKTAHHFQEALQREVELKQIVNDLSLSERVVHDEPPTLLYQALSSRINLQYPPVCSSPRASGRIK